ncbi:unnamed protein product, partial [Polarella glacialis]
ATGATIPAPPLVAGRRALAGLSPCFQVPVHTQQMAAEMPPPRLPIFAPIGPSHPVERVRLLSYDAESPAALATTAKAPSDAFSVWMVSVERAQEERLLVQAQQRFSTAGPQASLFDFKNWLQTASRAAEEATLQEMQRAQLRTWLLCVRRLSCCRQRNGDCFLSVYIPHEVKERINCFIGGRHTWGPIHAPRARAIAESAQRQLRRCEGILRAAALSALVARYVHLAVVQAAEAGCMACYTEIPTDDVAVQALFEVLAGEPQQTKEVGALLCAHLALDGFEVEPKYHDPEYGLWRGFWVDTCNRLRLVVQW